MGKTSISEWTIPLNWLYFFHCDAKMSPSHVLSTSKYLWANIFVHDIAYSVSFFIESLKYAWILAGKLIPQAVFTSVFSTILKKKHKITFLKSMDPCDKNKKSNKWANCSLMVCFYEANKTIQERTVGGRTAFCVCVRPKYFLPVLLPLALVRDPCLFASWFQWQRVTAFMISARVLLCGLWQVVENISTPFPGVSSERSFRNN